MGSTKILFCEYKFHQLLPSIIKKFQPIWTITSCIQMKISIKVDLCCYNFYGFPEVIKRIHVTNAIVKQCPSMILTEIPTFTTRCFNTRRYICIMYSHLCWHNLHYPGVSKLREFPYGEHCSALSQLLLSLLVYRDFNKDGTVLKNFSNYWISSKK